MHIFVTKKRKFDFSAEFYLICSGRVSIYCPIKMTTDSSTMDNLQKVSAQFHLSLKVFDANIAWLAWGIQTSPGNFHHIMDVLKRPYDFTSYKPWKRSREFCIAMPPSDSESNYSKVTFWKIDKSAFEVHRCLFSLPFHSKALMSAKVL